MIELNPKAIQAAKRRINRGLYHDPRNTREVELSPLQIANYIDCFGWDEYSSWFLAIDPSENERSIGRYLLPYGDLENVSKVLLEQALDAANRAGEYEIEHTTKRLLKALDED